MRRVASQRIQLFPAGAFRARDGRPQGPDWRIDGDIAARLIAAAAARETPYVIDYEHQSLSGDRAPAAGWFSRLEWSAGNGLFASDVKWTSAARQAIEADEYRYLSPVFAYDRDSGAITALLNVALTNNPALDGLPPVADWIAARRALAAASALPPTPPEPAMDELLERTRTFLNLPITASAAEAAAELQKLIDQLAGDGLADAAAGAARLASGASEIAALHSELASARAAADPAQFVPLAVHAEITRQVAELQGQIEARDRTDRLAAALADGRILPATQAYWQEQPLAALRAYLEHAQPIAALSRQQSASARPAGDASAPGTFTVPAGYRVNADRLAQHQRALAVMRDQNLPYAVAAARVGAAAV